MEFTLISVLSALVLTYVVSRVTLVLLKGMTEPLRLVTAHLASLVVLATIVGLTKAYFVSFAFDKTLVLVPPQLLWCLVDIMRSSFLAQES